eukprot:scaffold36642_cov95-Skeletonema_marinoi.AAC.1
MEAFTATHKAMDASAPAMREQTILIPPNSLLTHHPIQDRSIEAYIHLLCDTYGSTPGVIYVYFAEPTPTVLTNQALFL